MSCLICHDTGWKPLTTDPKRVTRCDCQLAERTARLLEMAHIPARYRHCDLSEFETDFAGASPTLASARLMAGRFVEEYGPQNKKGLLLVGTVGTGKTHLAVGIIKELIRTHGAACLFCDYRELLKQIQNSYNPSVDATELDFLRPVMEAEVLVLDELGAVKPSEWVWDTVSLVLSTRYNEELTTIVTTNYKDAPPMEEGATGEVAAARRANREQTLGDRITERVRSRLHEMCRKVELQGIDYRQRVKSASF